MSLLTYTDAFDGTTLGANWSASSAHPSIVTHNVSGGTFNSVHTTGGAANSDITSLQWTGPQGVFPGGFVAAKLILPAPPTGTYDYGSVVMRTYSTNYTQAAVVITATVGGNWMVRYYIDDDTISTTPVAWDSSQPYVHMSKAGTTTTFQRSADGLTYTTAATLTSDPASAFYSGTDSNQAPQTRVSAPYVTLGRSAPMFMWTTVAHTFSLDDVIYGYLEPVTEVAPKTATARWNNARNDIVGAYSGDRVRFAPI